MKRDGNIIMFDQNEDVILPSDCEWKETTGWSDPGRTFIKCESGSKDKILLMAIRQALLIALGAIETFLELPRSVTPKHSKGG